MKLELNSASDFLMNLLRLKKVDPLLDNTQLQNFKGSLESLLAVHYRSHWYPDLPNKGSGYRCIRINGKMDPLIVQAGIAVGLKPSTLSKMLPAELTLCKFSPLFDCFALFREKIVVPPIFHTYFSPLPFSHPLSTHRD